LIESCPSIKSYRRSCKPLRPAKSENLRPTHPPATGIGAVRRLRPVAPGSSSILTLVRVEPWAVGSAHAARPARKALSAHWPRRRRTTRRLAPEPAAGIARGKSAKSIGVRYGKWPPLKQGPGARERVGHRDHQAASRPRQNYRAPRPRAPHRCAMPALTHRWALFRADSRRRRRARHGARIRRTSAIRARAVAATANALLAPEPAASNRRCEGRCGKPEPRGLRAIRRLKPVEFSRVGDQDLVADGHLGRPSGKLV